MHPVTLQQEIDTLTAGLSFLRSCLAGRPGYPCETNTPAARAIIACVAESFDVDPEEILSSARPQYLCDARFAAIYLIQQRLGWSTTKISRLFKKRDHSCVIHALDRVQDMIRLDPGFHAKLMFLQSFLLASDQRRSAVNHPSHPCS